MSRVTDLSLDDKARLCSGLDMWNLEPIAQLGLESVMITDGPHGLRKQDRGIVGVPATCFPTAAGLAASWDPELAAEVGAAIGREALAEQVAVVLGPGVNIKRHPLCGRNFEYFSEDPLLTGEMAAGMIGGIQSVGVGTSIKHFAANNQEGKRMVLDTIVDERTLREIYLAGFERAIGATQPWTVMCAYNKINGTYCSENHWLLTEVLRDEWGFDGLVVTDWGATNDRVAGVRAGLDLEMPGSGGLNDAEIVAAVQEGRLEESAVDAVAQRVLDLIERGNAVPADHHTYDVDEHHRLARRAAADTAVLLTNDGFLPLDARRTIAVIGEFAVKPRYQGAGSSAVTPTRLDTLLDALRETVDDPAQVRYAAGYDAESDDLRPDLIDEAVLVARSADVVVVMAGLPERYESEAYDREHMRLPEQHNRLIEAVTDANPDMTVVLCNGSAVQIPWVDRPRAILEAFLGGQAAGSGIADVLYGVVNPSAKLSETFPLRQSDHASDRWFGDTGRQVQYREGLYVGYRWFDSAGADVLFPFGHGLSYTTFEYGSVSIDGVLDADSDDFLVTLSIPVTNSGGRAGAEVVQVYVRDVASSTDRPDRELGGFAKVRLAPGETKKVTVDLDRRAFAFYDVGAASWQIEAGGFELLVGSSSRDVRATETVEIASTFAPTTEAALETGSPVTMELLDDTFTDRLGHAVPAPDPVRPFHRNSTLGEVSVTAPGAAIKKAVVVALPRQFGDEIEIDDSMKRMLESVVVDAPLRSMVLLSGGKVSWRALDRIVAMLDRFPVRKSRRS